jgi:uncharacterized cofD-like protein
VTKPNVVALGGGHGLSVALRAAREYAGEITAIVSVADDGGSSGRLRRDLDVVAPGDLRRCLGALATGGGPWPDAFEYRCRAGELEGHALGNLMLIGLAETTGDLTGALDEMGRLLHTVGRVLPATLGPVKLSAEVGGTRVVGQVAVAHAHESIADLRIEPADASAPPDALAAIAAADQIVLAPGSLYTSIVAVCCVPDIRAALAAASAPVVQVANIDQENETSGLDGTDHLRVVLDHGGRVDVYLYDPSRGLAVDQAVVAKLGARAVGAPIADAERRVHDPVQLAQALSALL